MPCPDFQSEKTYSRLSWNNLGSLHTSVAYSLVPVMTFYQVLEFPTFDEGVQSMTNTADHFANDAYSLHYFYDTSNTLSPH